VALQTYKVGDLVRWDYQHFDDDGACHDGGMYGLVLEVSDSVHSGGEKCYRVIFHDEDVFGNTYQADQWLYGCEMIRVSKSLNK
tara:strand:+ start:220 stop:471 length:252 start_codon:yes stop_codon:yes gene_type:complete